MISSGNYKSIFIRGKKIPLNMMFSCKCMQFYCYKQFVSSEFHGYFGGFRYAKTCFPLGLQDRVESCPGDEFHHEFHHEFHPGLVILTHGCVRVRTDLN